MRTCTKSAIRHLAAIGLAMAASGPACAAGADGYQITTLAADSWSHLAFDVNNLGQVAVSTDRGVDGTKAYIYQNGGYTALGGPAGNVGVTVFGLSDTGAAVGSYFTEVKTFPDDGRPYLSGRKGFILDGGTYRTIAPVDAVDTQLRGISPDGRFVTGFYSTTAAFYNFVYDRDLDSYTIIPGYTNRTFSMLVQGVNRAGIVVGGIDLADGIPGGSRHGFTYNIWTGERIDFAYTGSGSGDEFRDITSTGFIVGWNQERYPSNTRHGIIGTGVGQIRFDVPGAASTTIGGINDAGWLSGSYTIGETSYGFLAKPVPEASTVSMLLAGLGAMAGLRLRGRRPSRVLAVAG